MIEIEMQVQICRYKGEHPEIFTDLCGSINRARDDNKQTKQNRGPQCNNCESYYVGK